jgi:pimeloyl-ACP methyl ester carboxylesterase
MMIAALRETVVLVHGLYVHGLWMSLLEYWLEQLGYQVVNFSYSTMTRSLSENAEDLQIIIKNIDTPTVHFLAHSMGGLVVRHLFHNHPEQHSGRVVTMGTPHQGSYAARIMHNIGLGCYVGRGLEGGLLGDAPAWNAINNLGSIAGTLNIGFGMILPGMLVPSDGLIAVVETKISGMCDHICLPVSHMQMLADYGVVYQASGFFNTGKFSH